MKLIIDTQFKENYGAHDWDGEGECPQYWKSKGGYTYVVENVSETDYTRILHNGIPTLTSLIEHKDDYSMEYIISYEFINDDEKIPCEPWENPIFLTYNRNIGAWTAYRKTPSETEGYPNFNDSRIEFKQETWTLLENGGQSDYAASFKVTGYGIVNYANIMSVLEECA
jgi:hypothetical protein